MSAVSERLPMPDWSRPGETWRVEPEDPPKARWTLDVGALLCDSRPRCDRDAIAGMVRGGELTLALCDEHLRDGRMWVENGRVVSWRLSR